MLNETFPVIFQHCDSDLDTVLVFHARGFIGTNALKGAV